MKTYKEKVFDIVNDVETGALHSEDAVEKIMGIFVFEGKYIHGDFFLKMPNGNIKV